MSSTATPLVSVVIPVFNAERYLRESIDTVLSQDYPEIEIIAVDDGSSDNSPAILEEYADSIRIVRQENAGSARARNAGIRCANGKYVAFLDADDMWHSAKTRIQVAHLEENPDVGLVYNDWLVINEGDEHRISEVMDAVQDDGTREIDPDESGWLYHKLLLDSLVHTTAAMMRKSVIDEVGFFDEALRKGQDYDYWIRASRVTRFDKIDRKLSIYRIHQGGVTQNPSPINYGARIIENALQTWGRVGPNGERVSAFAVRDRLSLLWYGYGALHMEFGDLEIARASLRKAAGAAPWRAGCWKKLFQSMLKRQPG